ncbi:MAG: thioredoxin domain-containing protein, partial [Clostridiales bacterium]|nr:thioredoxin domain-containing protein [Clostridiales bacterium]
FDAAWGGFGPAPKFPIGHNLLYLLRHSLLADAPAGRRMAEHTLTQMYRGGLFDHVGGGFSRYSTDQKWLVPHFEKMLYDNALLVDAYLEAYRHTGRPLYRLVARRTLDYVLRELTAPEGGFYCGQDADSEREEGKYYVFTPAELKAVLGERDGAWLCSWFGVTEGGNFEGSNVLNLLDNPQYETWDPALESLCLKLCRYRADRTVLHKDEKILTSWSSLMIAAFAKAGWLLSAPDYLRTARSAQRFLAERLMDKDGHLMIRWKDGEAAHAGQLADYSFYGLALLALYEATFEVRWLQEAAEIADKMLALFWDQAHGGFYLYASDSEQLIVRPKEIYDGAMPSGNAAAALLLVRLSKYTGETRWRQADQAQLAFLTSAIGGQPAGHSAALLAFLEVSYPSRELICVTAEHTAPPALMDLYRESPYLNLTTLVKTPAIARQLAEVAPFTASYPIPPQGTQYYLCRDYTCEAPVSDLNSLRDALNA